MSEDKTDPNAAPGSRESLERAAMQDEQMQNIHAQLMREKEEPHEGFSPIPVFLVFMIMILGFWAGTYLVLYSGDFRADAFDPKFKAGSTSLAAAPEISLFDRGAKIFRNQCAACHQGDGNGLPGVYPPLPGSEWVTDHPEILARILINGLNGPIVVKGNTYNGVMPAFGPSGLNLSSRDLASVMTYIRQEWGNQASEISIELTEQYLEAYAARTTPWQAPDLREDLGPLPGDAPAAPESDAPAEGDAPEAADAVASLL